VISQGRFWRIHIRITVDLFCKSQIKTYQESTQYFSNTGKSSTKDEVNAYRSYQLRFGDKAEGSLNFDWLSAALELKCLAEAKVPAICDLAAVTLFCSSACAHNTTPTGWTLFQSTFKSHHQNLFKSFAFLLSLIYAVHAPSFFFLKK